MHGVELVLISLLVAVAVLAAAARAIGVPYPIVLVLGGLVMGFVPGMPEVELDPDLVLVVFLPPLLYSAAFFASLRDLRDDIRSISLLAIGLVLATTCAVAVVAHALIDGLPWAAAFALGRDRRADRPAGRDRDRPRGSGLPRRIVHDPRGREPDQRRHRARRLPGGGRRGRRRASRSPTPGWSSCSARRAAIAIGLAVGWVIAEIRKRLDDPPVEVTISLLSGYAAYVPAERARRLGRARRGDDRHLHRLAGAGDLERAAAAGGLLDVGDPDVPAQRAAVRADRAAAPADPRGPARTSRSAS